MVTGARFPVGNMVPCQSLEDREQNATVGAAEALHDISNALTVVLGWLEEASREGADPALQARALDIAARKAREARALAREAIGAARPSDAARPIGDLIREVVEALTIELDRAGVRVEIRGGGAAPVRGAATVAHVITNLLLNAIAFTPRGSMVHVSLGGDAENVEVTLSDEGPGVDPGVAPALFDGRTTRPGGAGIGLRHAREMMRRLGGELFHVPGGRGATFTLSMPAYEPPTDERRTGRPNASPGQARSPSAQAILSAVAGARVLIVEDDRAVCALLDAGLTGRGMEVVAVHDGRALEPRLMQIGGADVVLLDLSPIAHDIDGAVAAVWRIRPDAGIVFISGSAVAIETELTRGSPRMRWVRKPFELGEITAAIAEVMPARER
jgi:CheY-like chemotaxis protein